MNFDVRDKGTEGLDAKADRCPFVGADLKDSLGFVLTQERCPYRLGAIKPVVCELLLHRHYLATDPAYFGAVLPCTADTLVPRVDGC